MLTELLLLAVGAGAFAYNSTQEVVVSSSPMVVRGAGGMAVPGTREEEAEVKPMELRRGGRDVGVSIGEKEEAEVKPKELREGGVGVSEESKEAEVKPMSKAIEARGMHKMKKTLKKWMPYLMVPTMMALGYAPFVLSSLKMMVMNAVMMNMMALNAAIFLTLRNMAFGPRLGQHVKYHNFGYSNQKKHHHHHPHIHHPHIHHPHHHGPPHHQH